MCRGLEAPAVMLISGIFSGRTTDFFGRAGLTFDEEAAEVNHTGPAMTRHRLRVASQ